MAHRNARLTPVTRRELVREVGRLAPGGGGPALPGLSSTVGKWVRRYQEAGTSGLEDRGSAPRRRPRRTPPEWSDASLGEAAPGLGPHRIGGRWVSPAPGRSGCASTALAVSTVSAACVRVTRESVRYERPCPRCPPPSGSCQLLHVQVQQVTGDRVFVAHALSGHAMQAVETVETEAPEHGVDRGAGDPQRPAMRCGPKPCAASPSRCVAPALVACAGDGGAVLSRGPQARTFPLPGSERLTLKLTRPSDERPGSAGPPPPGASRPPPPEPAPAEPASDARYDVPREVLPTAGACNTHSSRRGPSPATTFVGATASACAHHAATLRSVTAARRPGRAALRSGDGWPPLPLPGVRGAEPPPLKGGWVGDTLHSRVRIPEVSTP